MKHRVRKVGVLKAALIGGIAYALMALAFVPFALFMMFVSAPMMNELGGASGREWMMGPVFMLLAPLIYGVVGFVGTAIATAVYNLIAMMVGGLEIELEPIAGTPAPHTA